MRKAKKITPIEPALNVEQFRDILLKSSEPVIATNEYGNQKFFKTVMPYELVDNEIRCKNWRGDILEPPFLKNGQMFKVCDVEWED